MGDEIPMGFLLFFVIRNSIGVSYYFFLSNFTKFKLNNFRPVKNIPHINFTEIQLINSN